MRIAVQSGAPWEAKVGYARAVRVGDQIVVTGTTGLTPEGEPTEGAYGQAKQALANIEAALAKLGASTRDVVRTRIFVTDIARDWEEIGRAHGEVFATVRPATTMVEVSALIADWMVVEVEADAIAGSGASLGIEPAAFNDHPVVAALLSSEGLPLPGADDPPVRMWVARREGRVVGAAGLEIHRPEGLLRSVAVAPDARRSGVARALVQGVIGAAREEGLTSLYLLTVDRTQVFRRLGFSVVDRAGFTGPVSASREFAIHDCDDAKLMVKTPL